MRKPAKPPKTINLVSAYQLVEENPELKSFMVRLMDQYPHWDSVRRKDFPEGFSPNQAWAYLKFSRKFKQSSFKFWKWHFRYVLTDKILSSLHFIDSNCSGRLASDLPVSLDKVERDKIIVNSLMEEAIASSQLEGAATTRRIAKEFLRLKRKPRNDSEQMILNNYNSIQKIVNDECLELTPEYILELHQIITEDTLEKKDYEGFYRTTNDVVVHDPITGEIYHIPPCNYAKIPTIIRDFCNFANDDSSRFIHPIIKAIFLHFLISYIHPFNDGNGRLARAIFYWYVLKHGYWLFEFMPISRLIKKSKTNYSLAFLYTESDANDLTYFLNFNLKIIERSFSSLDQYLIKKKKEQAKALEILKSIREINFRQADILKQLISSPNKKILINEIASKYRVTYQTARSDLLSLVDLGYLNKEKVKKKFVFSKSNKPLRN